MLCLFYTTILLYDALAVLVADRPFTLRIVALQAFALGFPTSQGSVVAALGIGMTIMVSMMMIFVVVVLRHRAQLLELVRSS
jgi:hypothetical protein